MHGGPESDSIFDLDIRRIGDWNQLDELKLERGPALLGATDAAVSRGAGSDPLVIGYKNKTNPSTHTTQDSHEYTESTLSSVRLTKHNIRLMLCNVYTILASCIWRIPADECHHRASLLDCLIKEATVRRRVHKVC